MHGDFMKKDEFEVEVDKMCWEKFKYIPGEVSDHTELLKHTHMLLHTIQSDMSPHLGRELQKKISELNLEADELILNLELVRSKAADLHREAKKLVFGAKATKWKPAEVEKFHTEKNKIQKDLLTLVEKVQKLLKTLEKRGEVSG